MTTHERGKSSPLAVQSVPSCLDQDPCALRGWSLLDQKLFETSSPEHD